MDECPNCGDFNLWHNVTVMGENGQTLATGLAFCTSCYCAQDDEGE